MHIEIKWHKSVKSTSGGGVYMICFGEKFYIGRTRCLELRIRAHERDLNTRKVNGKWTCAATADYYQHILTHLQKNPGVEVAYMKVLKRCKTDEELVAAEQRYFDKYEWDLNCLNLGFVATPYREKNEHWVTGPKHKRGEAPIETKSSTVRYYDGTGKAKIRTRKQINDISLKRRT